MKAVFARDDSEGGNEKIRLDQNNTACAFYPVDCSSPGSHL
jgi:hypothetical protein